MKAANKVRTRSRLNQEWRWGYAFIMPALIGAVAFGFFPLLYSCCMMFTDWDGMTTPVFTGIDNFTRLFGDRVFWFELRNTFIYAFGSVPLTLLLSVLLANALNARRGPVGLMRVIYYLPAVTMPVAVAAVWKWMFNSKAGLINVMLGAIGITGPNWLYDTRYVLVAVIIVSVWSGMGYNMIILLSALKNIPSVYHEAARIDGARNHQVFFRITMPLLSPTLFFLSITSLITAFKTFDIVYMFSGVGSGNQMPTETINSLRTIVYGVYQNGFKFMDMGYAAAEAFVLLLIILCVTGVQFFGQKYWVNYNI